MVREPTEDCRLFNSAMFALFVVVSVLIKPAVSESVFVLFNCNISFWFSFIKISMPWLELTRAYADNAIAATTAMANRKRTTTKAIYLAFK